MRTRALLLVLALTACSRAADSTDETPESDPATTTATVETKPAGDPEGTVTHHSLTIDGHERTYRLYVPRATPDGPMPLFIGLHGGTGWADQLARTDHIEGLAESNGFVVVHPDGVKVAGGPCGVWNGGMCCGVAARDEIDDVAFVDALIDEISADQEIDPHRTFAYGHSNGGIMSYRLACELGDRIVGIGVVAGTLGIETCDPAQPVSLLHVHGTADENLPIAGGVGPRSIAGVDFPPPTDGFATLADQDGCPDAEEIADPGSDVTVTRRQPCDGGTAATFVTIEGASHAWPGGTPRATPPSGAGYAGYDATAEIVAFLLDHPRP